MVWAQAYSDTGEVNWVTELAAGIAVRDTDPVGRVLPFLRRGCLAIQNALIEVVILVVGLCREGRVNGFSLAVSRAEKALAVEIVRSQASWDAPAIGNSGVCGVIEFGPFTIRGVAPFRGQALVVRVTSIQRGIDVRTVINAGVCWYMKPPGCAVLDALVPRRIEMPALIRAVNVFFGPAGGLVSAGPIILANESREVDLAFGVAEVGRDMDVVRVAAGLADPGV